MTAPGHGDAQAPAPVVAVLGTGTMGAGMVRSMRRAGIPVRTWNRDGAKARALTGTGAEAFDSPTAAVAGADVVVTMLMDADAVADVIQQAAPASGTVWLQTSTLGLEGAERTIELADRLGLVLVDCPVMGTKKPAEEGALVLLASGDEQAAAGLAPVFEAVGRKTLWLGEAGAGSRLKLACNAWVLMLTAGVAQSVALARGLGVDPRDFFAVLEGGPLASPYAVVKGGAMMAGEYPVSFSLAGGMKDGRLIRDALRAAGLEETLVAALLETMAVAADRVTDPGTVDMAAVIEALPRDGR